MHPGLSAPAGGDTARSGVSRASCLEAEPSSSPARQHAEGLDGGGFDVDDLLHWATTSGGHVGA